MFRQAYGDHESCLDCHGKVDDVRKPDFIDEFGDMVAAYGGESKIGGFDGGKGIRGPGRLCPEDKPYRIARSAVNKIGLVLMLSGIVMVLLLWQAVRHPCPSAGCRSLRDGRPDQPGGSWRDRASRQGEGRDRTVDGWIQSHEQKPVQGRQAAEGRVDALRVDRQASSGAHRKEVPAIVLGLDLGRRRVLRRSLTSRDSFACSSTMKSASGPMHLLYAFLTCSSSSGGIAGTCAFGGDGIRPGPNVPGRDPRPASAGGGVAGDAERRNPAVDLPPPFFLLSVG